MTIEGDAAASGGAFGLVVEYLLLQIGRTETEMRGRVHAAYLMMC